MSPVSLRMRQQEDEDKTLRAGRMEIEGSIGLTSARPGLRGDRELTNRRSQTQRSTVTTATL